jgi:formiminoglutamase
MTWMHIERSDAPLILAFPHGGSEIPIDLIAAFRSRWWAVRDTDWHIAELYRGLCDATLIWTDISRSIIDCNRDPGGASLYPGQTTTGLCPIETFDGDPLYTQDAGPDVAARRELYFAPYHAAIETEIVRLRAIHPRVVLYDCHSIRSRIPSLFDGELPELNVGTDNGKTCDIALSDAVVAACGGRSLVLNGRFRGGWTTRHYGRPSQSVHAIQMEIAMRAYLCEPADELGAANWPPAFDPAYAASLRADLTRVLAAVSAFAKGSS